MFTKDPVLVGLILAVVVLAIVYWVSTNRTRCGGRVNLTSLGAPRWKSAGPYVNRRKDMFKNPYTRTDYPKKYKPAADGSRKIASALTDADPNVVQAAKYAQWKAFTSCTRGGYYKENLEDKRMKEFVQQDINDLCEAGVTAAKTTAQLDASLSKADATKKANCKEYCGAKAFELGYWCKHPTDVKKCCRKNDGKGGCADKLRDDPVPAAAPTNSSASNAASVTTTCSEFQEKDSSGVCKCRSDTTWDGKECVCGADKTWNNTTRKCDPKSASSGVSGVTVYKDAGFRGMDKTYAVGEYTDMGSGWNDQISSMKIPAGVKVILYQNINFGGKSLTLSTGNHENLGHFAFGDQPMYGLKDGQYAGNGNHCGHKFSGCWNDSASSMKVQNA